MELKTILAYIRALVVGMRSTDLDDDETAALIIGQILALLTAIGRLAQGDEPARLPSYEDALAEYRKSRGINNTPQ